MKKIYHTDFDKPHRCPFRGTDKCKNGYVSSEETGWRFRFWHVYECSECHTRVARWPLLPHIQGTWNALAGYVTWRWRIKWFWWNGPKLRWQATYWPHLEHKMIRLWFGPLR